MFEAFARLVRRVSSSTLCSEGLSRQFSQSADAWINFYGWWPKRRYFSSSKMRIPARNMANPRALSKPPARDADTRKEQAAPTRNQPRRRSLRRLPGLSPSRRRFQWSWVVGGAAKPTKITMPSPPGFPPKSITTSGFQLLIDQMLPA